MIPSCRLTGFTPEEEARGATLVATGETAMRRSLPPYLQDAAALAYRPLLIAMAAMIVEAERSRAWRVVVPGERA